MNEDKLGAGQFIAYLREKKLLLLIAAALIAGTALLIFGGSIGEGRVRADTEPAAYPAAAELEAKVKALCERVAGVSDAAVMITLESYGKRVYAKNSQRNADGDERQEYVTVSGELAPIAELPPGVAGIAVVCVGGDDPALQLRLTNLLCALFGIPATAVSIVGGK